MGFIAVKKNKRTCGNSLFFILIVYSEVSAADIHQQKTVIRIPVQPVAAFIEEKTGDDRIKEGMGSQPYG